MPSLDAAFLKSRVSAGVMGLLLGFTGVHRFYLGYVTQGTVMLGLTLVAGAMPLVLAIGLATANEAPIGARLSQMAAGYLAVVPAVMFAWGVVEGWLLLACFFNHDARGLPLRD